MASQLSGAMDLVGSITGAADTASDNIMGYMQQGIDMKQWEKQFGLDKDKWGIEKALLLSQLSENQSAMDWKKAFRNAMTRK